MIMSKLSFSLLYLKFKK